jgi:hypothetical protein
MTGPPSKRSEAEWFAALIKTQSKSPLFPQLTKRRQGHPKKEGGYPRVCLRGGDIAEQECQDSRSHGSKDEIHVL